MRVPLSWLRELVDVEVEPTVLAERLSLAGLPIESIEEVGDLHPEVRAGRLVSVEQHPGADRLRVCRVDLGGNAPVQIVSAAPGLKVGALVALALPGARLPGGRDVASVELRGQASAGVLCSELELGLGDDDAGVLHLDGTIAAGTALRDLPGVHDVVLDVEITPNRGDCLSILGIAREVAAVTGTRVLRPRVEVKEEGAPAAGVVSVHVDAVDLCPRYCARVVRGVGHGPSPLWLRLRLQRAGMRPLGGIVDATNYVMLERGQPMHAFDLARVKDGRIIVRRASADERLVTLDGVERALLKDDLVIADPSAAVALAGVMGGRDSEVSDATIDLLLESAFFAPAAVRRTSRRLGLLSQASYRFERRVDPAMVPEALDAVAALIVRIAGGTVAPGVVEDAPGAGALAAPTIRFRPRRAASVLGADVSDAEMLQRLELLGMTVRPDADAVLVTPPSHRGDVTIEEDLIEEVARLGGYDAIPATLPVAPSHATSDSPSRRLARTIRRLLVAEGLSETVTLTFTDAETNAVLPGVVGAALRPVAVRNPLASELGELRRSPLVGLVRALRHNVAQGARYVGLFEVGKGYGLGDSAMPREPRAVSGLLCGQWPARGVEREGPAIDFLDLKGVVENLLAGLGVADASWLPMADLDFLHPGKAAAIVTADGPLGVAGALHPRAVQVLDLPQEVWVFELDFQTLGAYGPARFGVRPLPRFPAVTRDIAVVVDEVFLAEAIVEEVRSLADPRIETARVFDCYRGEPIPPGKKSLAYTLAYRAPDRTLTDDEVNALHAEVRERLKKRFALELRS